MYRLASILFPYLVELTKIKQRNRGDWPPEVTKADSNKQPVGTDIQPHHVLYEKFVNSNKCNETIFY